MTITLDLAPEIERGLLAQAQAEGVSITDYVEQLVEREARLGTPIKPAPPAKNLYELLTPVRGLLTDEEIDQSFRRDPAPGRAVDLA